MNLEHYINKDNWPFDLPKAKAFARKALENWQWKEKAPYYLAQIDRTKSVKKLQELVVYTLLSGEGLRVIK